MKRGATGSFNATPTVLRAHVEKRLFAWKPDFAAQIPMSSMRRSPIKKVSPKPELPKKPRKPQRVEDPAANSVRQANYQAELAAC